MEGRVTRDPESIKGLETRISAKVKKWSIKKKSGPWDPGFQLEGY